jgi:hypothetical protein
MKLVEPTMSANSTVACLRSSPADPSHLGCWLVVPHQMQNSVAVWTACPQAAQMLSTPAPQFGQNRLPWEVTESHCVHRMLIGTGAAPILHERFRQMTFV